ncbi:fimbria/pilus outer membrane usher protein [Klebsiella sp. RHBSTW-00484]|uniref:fimbria/pilus outer membrane usher protein n=1 Tax=unclassified Klebsiella TaxID=2608929 RepID=UPI0015E54391|nr:MULTISPECIES: fimbria/pilus outer membrane usher protein [unclassified Klebsiella]MBA7843251.1 fimbria/pilus outer membrane usher protein [Klebsiella sp. RHBSTW-00465]QLO38623.1 fimbria/pilus outer membrane usher protein [Klebsiella sp. RHBSTW-00484]QLT78143.1 fimbria/pilus outer membrane usher protein [Klebsiella sp. RHBSTW-00464]
MKKKSPLAITLASLFFQAGFTAHASELYFPPEFMGADAEAAAALHIFQSAGAQRPGEYLVEVFLNDRTQGQRTLTFTPREIPTQGYRSRDNTGLSACLTRELMASLGVKIDLFPALASLAEDECVAPEKAIQDAWARFDFTRMQLFISIPQASLHHQARGYIEPSLWDEGINAALLNYNFSGGNTFAGKSDSNNYFLNLNSGINFGGWRLRDFRTWSYYSNEYQTQQSRQRLKTYVERSVIPLRSNLVIGESSTSNQVFDSTGFKGISLSTNDNMYPDTMRGFAPVVRGVAESNAQVMIRQNGYNIYQMNVSPGAFEITDLYPMYSSGDLEVSVKEASGNTHVFTVPYSSVPMLQREGRVTYSLTAGLFSGSSDRYDDPAFGEATLLWGLPHNVTIYGGVQYSDNYMAEQLGLGLNMGAIGAFSADVTHADSTLADGSRHQGQSVRFLYAHSFSPTGTNLRLTGYRYSTKGFHTLDETALKTMRGRLYDHDEYDEYGNLNQDTYSDYYNLYNTKRARLEANISQSLGSIGSLYITGVKQTYWNSGDSSTSLQTGYSSALGPLSYSLSYSYNQQKNESNPSWTDKTFNLSLSVPLDRLFSWKSDSRSVYATFYGSRDNHGNLSQQAGLSGTALDGNTLNWNVSQGYSHSGNGNGSGGTGNAGINHRGGYGASSLGYSYSEDYQRVNYGLSGALVAHRNGLTQGQQVADSAVLVAAPGASGVSVKGATGVSTDWRGYAIKPYATAYRENSVSLDTSTLDDKTDIDSGVARVVPTKGAIVRARFDVQRGHRGIMTLTRDGKPLPFGTMIAGEKISGIVGDGGQVYLSGLQDKGTLTAKWGDKHHQQCAITYRISDREQNAAIAYISAICR